MMNWLNKRVLIIGAARQGVALARYLSDQGAKVTLNDRQTAEKLFAVQAQLAQYPVEWALGGHSVELLDDKDLVCLSGGVPLNLPLVVEAARRGIPISNDTEIFLSEVPCQVIGITGSAGKTTTTTLVGRMAKYAVQAPHRCWVGGNIGLPLVEFLKDIRPGDLVVLELSSFQLDLVTHSANIAAVLNITPNHLDRHGTMAAYIAAKTRILTFQSPNDCAVLNREDPESWNLAGKVRGKLVSFGMHRPESEFTGTYTEENRLYWQTGKGPVEILHKNEILLRGEHNLMNVLAASAIALAAGFPSESVRSGVAGFTGVDHRLEFVREWGGARWYNDSIATAPERTMAAIQAFDEPIVLLLGGRDKKLPWGKLAELIHERVDHVILFGEAAEMIENVLNPLEPDKRPYSLQRCVELEEAVKKAAEIVTPGDVVLLSPGGTSYDKFIDFAERGEAYRLWVNRLP